MNSKMIRIPIKRVSVPHSIDQVVIHVFLLTGFTGIDSAYEPPDSPDLALRTDVDGVGSCVQQCISLLELAGIVPRSAIETVEVSKSTPTPLPFPIILCLWGLFISGDMCLMFVGAVYFCGMCLMFVRVVCLC